MLQLISVASANCVLILIFAAFVVAVQCTLRLPGHWSEVGTLAFVAACIAGCGLLCAQSEK
jgi:hypothetical protein